MSLKQKILAEIDALTVAEQFELVKDILDKLAEYQTPQPMEITPEQDKELEDRYQRFLANPDNGSSWEQVEERIKVSAR